jgi:hypothetical protein
VAGDQLFGMNAADVYRSGCRELTNMIVLPQGGAYKREGFKFGRDVTDDIPNAPTDGLSYRTFALRGESADIVLLMVPGEAWVYALPTFQVIGHDVSPYTLSDLKSLGVAQYNDTVIIYSPAHRPRKITFKTPVALTDPGVNFIAPLYTYEDDASPISQTSTWTLKITYSAAGVVGNAYFQVSGIYAVSSKGQLVLSSFYQADGGSTTVGIAEVLNKYISAVVPGSAVVDIASTVGFVTTYNISFKYYSSKGDGTGILGFFSLGGSVVSPEITNYEFKKTNNAQGDSEPLWSGPFLMLHGGIYYECIATNIGASTNEPGVGANTATYWIARGATIPLDKDYDIAVAAWAIDDSYSPRGRGWPGEMAFHEQRLVGSGPPDAPSVIAAAMIVGSARSLDFTLGVNDDDGILFRLASADNSIIRWIFSAQILFIGTSAGVYAQFARPWTPTNVSFIRINGYNCSKEIHATEVDGDVFFPTIDDRQIRQVQFSNDLQTWQSWDLTSFAEHLFTMKNRLKRLASFQSTETYLWAVRTDGALMGMSYAPSQTAYHALAWHKHSLSDPVIDILTGYDGNGMSLITLVNRYTYNPAIGAFENHPCFEIMEGTSQNLFDATPTFFADQINLDEPLAWTVTPYAGKDWSVHLDSFVQQTGTGDTQLTMPARFAGRVVQVVEDGVYLGQFIPDYAGRINVETVLGSTVSIGFGYVARIEPNRLESQQQMTSQSQKIRWVLPVMRLLTSAMPKLNGVRPNEKTQDDFYDAATGLFSGDVKIANFGSDGKIVIEQDLPLPLHLTGIFGLMTTEEG